MHATIDASPLSSEVWSDVEPLRLTRNYRAREDPEWATAMMKIANGTFDNATRAPNVPQGYVLDLSDYVPASNVFHCGQEEEAIKSVFGEDLQVMLHQGGSHIVLYR